jgi:hypothetical protein
MEGQQQIRVGKQPSGPGDGEVPAGCRRARLGASRLGVVRPQRVLLVRGIVHCPLQTRDLGEGEGGEEGEGEGEGPGEVRDSLMTWASRRAISPSRASRSPPSEQISSWRAPASPSAAVHSFSAFSRC